MDPKYEKPPRKKCKKFQTFHEDISNSKRPRIKEPTVPVTMVLNDSTRTDCVMVAECEPESRASRVPDNMMVCVQVVRQPPVAVTMATHAPVTVETPSPVAMSTPPKRERYTVKTSPVTPFTPVHEDSHYFVQESTWKLWHSQVSVSISHEDITSRQSMSSSCNRDITSSRSMSSSNNSDITSSQSMFSSSHEDITSSQSMSSSSNEDITSSQSMSSSSNEGITSKQSMSSSSHQDNLYRKSSSPHQHNTSRNPSSLNFTDCQYQRTFNIKRPEKRKLFWNDHEVQYGSPDISQSEVSKWKLSKSIQSQCQGTEDTTWVPVKRHPIRLRELSGDIMHDSNALCASVQTTRSTYDGRKTIENKATRNSQLYQTSTRQRSDTELVDGHNSDNKLNNSTFQHVQGYFHEHHLSKCLLFPSTSLSSSPATSSSTATSSPSKETSPAMVSSPAIETSPSIKSSPAIESATVTPVCPATFTQIEPQEPPASCAAHMSHDIPTSPNSDLDSGVFSLESQPISPQDINDLSIDQDPEDPDLTDVAQNLIDYISSLPLSELENMLALCDNHLYDNQTLLDLSL